MVLECQWQAGWQSADKQGGHRHGDSQESKPQQIKYIAGNDSFNEHNQTVEGNLVKAIFSRTAK